MNRYFADWPLSRVLLMNDVRFPWLILVPRRRGAAELHELAEDDRLVLIGELARASATLKKETGADKIDIGVVGNVVSNFHVHVVARFANDPAWPGPAWGYGAAEPYSLAAAEQMIEKLRRAFAV